jgi:uncharacterized protein (DUF1501 family)
MDLMNRRDFLRMGKPATMPREAMEERVLVCVFLRGGADGLSLVVPHGEDRYYLLRPTLAIPRPDDARAKREERAIDLDGFFGLHPKLAPLLPAWKEGALRVVHAVGSDDETRSHFEAQDRMEHAGDRPSGWIARHLATRPGPPPGALGAVAFGARLPESLRGAPLASAVTSVDELRLGDGDTRATAAALASLYAMTGENGLAARLGDAGRATLGVLARLDAVKRDAPRAAYPKGDFGRALAQIAALVRARAGIEVACVDLGNWDSHFLQAQIVPDLAAQLAAGLAAFREDLGPDRARVDVVVMTEFGRRARENGSLGTDHGHGSVMLALGDGLGGPVRGAWPGLDDASLAGPGDLAVTTDHRDVLAEILRDRFGSPRAIEVLRG